MNESIKHWRDALIGTALYLLLLGAIDPAPAAEIPRVNERTTMQTASHPITNVIPFRRAQRPLSRINPDELLRHRDTLTVAAVMQREEEAIADLLSRVGVRITPADMADWTGLQWAQAEKWASTAYLWDPKWPKPCPAMPDFLAPFAVITGEE